MPSQVEYIIKAKDEATATIKKVTSEFNNLDKSTNMFVGANGKLSKSMQTSARAASTLASSLGGGAGALGGVLGALAGPGGWILAATAALTLFIQKIVDSNKEVTELKKKLRDLRADETSEKLANIKEDIAEHDKKKPLEFPVEGDRAGAIAKRLIATEYAKWLTEREIMVEEEIQLEKRLAKETEQTNNENLRKQKQANTERWKLLDQERAYLVARGKLAAALKMDPEKVGGAQFQFDEIATEALSLRAQRGRGMRPARPNSAPGSKDLTREMEGQVAAWKKLNEQSERFQETWAGAITSNILSFFDSFTSGVEEFGKAFGEMILGMIADTMRLIAQLLIVNALKKSSLFGFLFHDGGVVGEGGVSTAHDGASIDMFGNLTRAHSGMGFGLAHDEVPIIAQTGERILSREQNQAYEAGMSMGGGDIREQNQAYQAGGGAIKHHFQCHHIRLKIVQ